MSTVGTQCADSLLVPALFFKAPPLDYFLNGLSEPLPKAMPKRPAAHHPLAFSATHAEQQDRQFNAQWRRMVLPRISTQSSDDIAIEILFPPIKAPPPPKASPLPLTESPNSARFKAPPPPKYSRGSHVSINERSDSSSESVPFLCPSSSSTHSSTHSSLPDLIGSEASTTQSGYSDASSVAMTTSSAGFASLWSPPASPKTP